MRRIAFYVLAAGVGLGMSAANAMTVAPAPAAQGFATQVAYGCGPGMTRGPGGHCRPRFTCPAGFHTGPQGMHCYRNH